MFHASVLLSFSFFRLLRHHRLWFSHNSRSAQEACRGEKTGPLSLFPLLDKDHIAKFNTNNKIAGAQNTHFLIDEG